MTPSLPNPASPNPAHGKPGEQGKADAAAAARAAAPIRDDDVLRLRDDDGDQPARPAAGAGPAGANSRAAPGAHGETGPRTTGPRPARDLGETSPMAKVNGKDPGETSATEIKPPPSVQQVEAAIQEAAKSGTNLDTLIGRLVVEQGFVTEDEVAACLDRVRQSAAERNQTSLAQMLVDGEFLTKRQLERLKSQVDAERSGQLIPGFKIIGKLGAGAMATVFKAKQISLDRMVAIKVLPKKFTSSAQFVERFYAEGRAAAQLNHPNIVQAYDVGKVGDTHYFVMEYVEGRTVYDDIHRHKRFNEREAVEITIQMAEALQHAHERGLIHRDVKPKNIMISKEGVAKLADMGLARAITDKEAAEAEAGKAFGTPYYISPEQIRGEVNIGPATDIYSLGATLYHMVTGNVPFDGKNPTAVMHKHLHAQAIPPDHVNPRLSAGISEVIEMMMAKSPRARYQNCKDLLIDLRAVRDGKTPVIAHKEIGGVDLAGLAQAEAAATPAELPQVAGETRPFLRTPMFILMVVLLVISVAVNILQAVRGG